MSTIAHYLKVAGFIPLLVVALLLSFSLPQLAVAQDIQDVREEESEEVENEFESVDATTLEESEASEEELENAPRSAVVPMRPTCAGGKGWQSRSCGQDTEFPLAIKYPRPCSRLQRGRSANNKRE